MNSISLIGRLTKNADVRYMQNDKIKARFTLAVSKKYKNKNGDRDADFINIVAWGKTAEFVKNYTTKGQQIGLTGRIETNNYTDKNGVRHYNTDVVADSIFFADSKREIKESDVEHMPMNEVDKKFEEFTMNEFSGSPDNDLPF